MAEFYGVPADELLDRSPERLGICYVAWEAVTTARNKQRATTNPLPVVVV